MCETVISIISKVNATEIAFEYIEYVYNENIIIFSLFINIAFANYNTNIANNSAVLSANTYCDKENYKKIEIPGFELKSIFSNKGSDMEGFIGTLQKLYILRLEVHRLFETG